MTAARDTVPAPLLVLGSVVSVQVGQAVGKQMFGLLEPAGVVTVRLGLAAFVLLAVRRPRPPTSARSVGLVLALGTAIAGMNLVYPSMRHLPLGVATALQLLGPLAVALVGSRHARDAVWALLACAGVLLLHHPAGGHELPVVGVLLALGSGVSMGLYLLIGRQAGVAAGSTATLALAVAWAAVVSLPFGVAASGADLVRPHVLAAGLGLAVLSAVLPYSLDLAALRRLPPRTVGVLESLEPVVGALAGLALLAEHLAAERWLAIACITAAAIGAAAAAHGPRRVPPTTGGVPSA